jgi:hypothetical protein
MLTDSCGLQSTGNLSGAPSMNLTSDITYSASQSAYQGNAIKLNGSLYNSASAYSNMLNLPMTGGFTLSGWYYIEKTKSSSLFCDFAYTTASGSSSWQFNFFLQNGGLNYGLGNHCSFLFYLQGFQCHRSDSN